MTAKKKRTRKRDARVKKVNHPLIGEHYYTSSEMALYRYCRRSWWLKTYRRLRLKPHLHRPSKARVGTLVHAGLEILYDPTQDDPDGWAGILDDERVRLDLMLTTDLVDEQWHKDMLEQVEHARIIIEGYVEWTKETGADQGLTFIAAEKKVKATLLGVNFLGKLDSILRDEDGAFLYMDHKTTT